MNVSRASHAHQMPQMMRAQTIPVARLIAPNNSATSVTETANESAREVFFARDNMTLATIDDERSTS